MLSVQNLSFHYPGDETWALDHLSLEINQGEWIVLAGKSGCGKSTLALALGGFLFNQYPEQIEGTLIVDGLDARATPLYEIADRVGLVQQNPEAQFCTLMVEDEIVFGLENRRLALVEIEERLEWALDVTSCLHLRERSLASLSGGEKQKIAIAAMLAAKPNILIFDEPTSNLDPSATAEIFKVIQQIRERTAITVIVIEHKLNFMRKFQPRLIEMQAGKIVRDQPLDTWQQPAYKNKNPLTGRLDAEACLALRDVSAGYDQEPFLEKINLEVFPGELVAVMGDNGSGKSTLLQTIANLIQPVQGSVVLSGENTANLPVSQIARWLGYIFQNPAHQLFANSVWEEAIFAPINFGILDEAMEAAARLLLQRAGLQEREKAHPFLLSYGQMRRLNLISVLVYRPKLYLLDELLIGQDVENGMFLLEQLQGMLQQGAAVVMVNHNPEAVSAFATRIVFMEAGRILFDLPVQAGFARLAEMGKLAYLPSAYRDQGSVH
jgi:energy-coupling factor transport system ATP-binding protein